MKKFTRIAMLAFAVFAITKTDKVCAQDAYIGEIRMFAGNYAPINWQACNGQLMPISSYSALFAILGTTYGGDGITTFGLPDFRSRVPMGQGQGTGLTYSDVGAKQGSETVTLISSNIPAHTHLLNVYNGAGDIDSLTAAGSSLALPLNADLSRAAGFTAFSPNMALNPNTIAPSTGGSIPVGVKQPSLTVMFIICTAGIWPSHP